MATLGDRIDKFTLVRQLGAGGMGATWEAVRQSGHDFEQRVAIKLAAPEVLATTDGLASFRREAALAASLRHPNIAAVLDVDERAGYIVCELVDGSDLRAVLKGVPGGRLDPVITVHVLGQIARGLAHAHRRILRGRSSPVIHRDMSPGNVVIDYDGNVKIVDFGIAKAMINGVDVPESLKGKLSYMAPEQVMGGRMDGRVDQYALGVIAYEALTGVRPNDGAHEGETLSCILGGKRMPIGQRLPSLAPGLARIVERMMALRPEQRFPSMDALLDALSAFTPPLTTHRSLIPLVIAARQPHTIVHENGRFVSRPVDVEPILSALQPASDEGARTRSAASPPLLPVRRRDAGPQALLATLGSTDPAAPKVAAVLEEIAHVRLPPSGAAEADAWLARPAPLPLTAAEEPEPTAAPAVARIVPAHIIGSAAELARTEQAPLVARDATVGFTRAAVVRDGQAPVIVSRERMLQGGLARAISGAALEDTAVAHEPGSRQHASGEFVHVAAPPAQPNADAELAASALPVRDAPGGPGRTSLHDSQRQLIAARPYGVHPLDDTDQGSPLRPSFETTMLGISPLTAAAGADRRGPQVDLDAGRARHAAAPGVREPTTHEPRPLMAAAERRGAQADLDLALAQHDASVAHDAALHTAYAPAAAADVRGAQGDLGLDRARDAAPIALDATMHEASPLMAAAAGGNGRAAQAGLEPSGAQHAAPIALDATMHEASPLMAAAAGGNGRAAQAGLEPGRAQHAAPIALDATMHEAPPLMAADVSEQRAPSGSIQLGATALAPSSVPPALPSARTRAGAASGQSEVRRTRVVDAVDDVVAVEPAAADSEPRAPSRSRWLYPASLGLGAALVAGVAWVALAPHALGFLSSRPAAPAADSGVTVHSAAPGHSAHAKLALPPAQASSASALMAAEGAAAPAPLAPQPTAAMGAEAQPSAASSASVPRSASSASMQPTAASVAVVQATAANGAVTRPTAASSAVAQPTAASSAVVRPTTASGAGARPTAASAAGSQPTAAESARRSRSGEGVAHARVRVSPHAQVWVDDRPRGEAAPLLRLTLPAGTHVIAVGRDAPLQSRTVELKSGSSKLIAFDLRTP